MSMTASAVRDALNYYRRRTTNVIKRVESEHPLLNRSAAWSKLIENFWNAFDRKDLRKCKEIYDSMALEEEKSNKEKEILRNQ